MAAKDKRTTEQVLQHHLQALMAQDLEAIVDDYADNAVLITAAGISRGKSGVRDTYKAVLGMVAPETQANMKIVSQQIADDYALMLWTELPLVTFGADSFHIQNGKIVMQAAAVEMKT
ncbi:MAG: nuclear transport factor 2 family protein [Dehalococcoidales bacterium]|jgi:ketosteroid isomerase-like protein